VVPRVGDLGAIDERHLFRKDALHTLIAAFDVAGLDERPTYVLAGTQVLRRLALLAASLCPREVCVADHLPNSLNTLIATLLRMSMFPSFNIHPGQVIVVHRRSGVVLL
jgi:hypothetical protein